MNLEKKATAVSNYVVKNRAKITFAITSAVFVTMMVNVANQHNKFLTEKGLFNEFYQITE